MTRTIGEAGYWSGLAAFASTVAYSLVQILQLVGVVQFPLDEVLIYGTSLCIVIPFVFEILSFHYLTPNNRHFWTHAYLIFTIIYAVFVTANYVVQLATVIPSKSGGTSGLFASSNRLRTRCFGTTMLSATYQWAWRP